MKKYIVGFILVTVLTGTVCGWVPKEEVTSPLTRRLLQTGTPYTRLVNQLNDARVSHINLTEDVVLLDKLPVVRRSLVIEGHCRKRPCRIDGRGVHRLLRFSGPEAPVPIKVFSITLKNLVLANGVGVFYGDNVDTGSFAINQAGAAVQLWGAVGLWAHKVVFENNTALYDSQAGDLFSQPAYGGAVYYSGWYIENPATFLDLPIPSGSLSFTRCTFRNNCAPHGGGAIYFEGPQRRLSISNCTFVGNKVGGGVTAGQTVVGGGAVLSRAPTVITNSYFEQNTAGAAGGAVRITGDIYTNTPPVFYNLGVDNFVTGVVSNSYFKGNAAPRGGAIAASDGTAFSFCRNTFVSNAIIQKDPATVNQTNNVHLIVARFTVQATFCPALPTRSLVWCPPSLRRCRGVVAIETCSQDTPTCSATIKPLTAENRLQLALMNPSKDIRINITEDVVLTSDLPWVTTTAYLAERSVTVLGRCRVKAKKFRWCVIDGQKKRAMFKFGQENQQQFEFDKGVLFTLNRLVLQNAKGPAVRTYAGAAFIVSTVFTGNGRVDCNYPACTSPNCNVFNPCCGGAVQSWPMIRPGEGEDVHGSLYVDRSTFINNTNGAGGAVCTGWQVPLTLTGSTFQGNRALQKGGAIFSSSNVKVDRCLLEANRAVTGGAIELLQVRDVESNQELGAARLAIRQSTVRRNTASALGGAINVGATWDIRLTGLKVCNSTISSNTVGDPAFAYTGNIALMSLQGCCGTPPTRDTVPATFCPRPPLLSGVYKADGIISPTTTPAGSVSCSSACS